MSDAVRLLDLPLAWFDREQYRPRVVEQGRSVWHVLSKAVTPATTVPAEKPREPACGRSALRAAFDATYDRWKLPRAPAVELSLRELEMPGTPVVVAGQQPGFLGGPLHTVFKALSAIAASRYRRELTGEPCVPVFWVAGDDHDLDEVRDAWLPAAGGEACFRFPAEADRRPVSDYPVDRAAAEVLDAAKEHLAQRRFGDLAASLLDLYPGRGLAGGFAAMLAQLLGPLGLVILDPASVRPLAERIFRGVIEEPARILELVRQGRSDVQRKGLEPFVAERLPLFVVRDGRRHHLSPAAGGLQVDGGGPALSTREALEQLEREPGSFSHGALLRPMVQEECLPCVLSVGGPAEVGYFAQIAPLAAHFGFDPPRIGLRCNATLVDGKSARLAESLGAEVIARARAPEELLPPEPEPEALRSARESAANAGENMLRAIAELAPPADQARLERLARKAAGDASGVVDRLARGLVAARGREVDGARKLWSILFPSGELQERRWGMIHFVAKHGASFLEEIAGEIARDPLRIVHRLVLFET